MGTTNDNDHNQMQQPREEANDSTRQTDWSRPAGAPIPPAGYSPKNASEASPQQSEQNQSGQPFAYHQPVQPSDNAPGQTIMQQPEAKMPQQNQQEPETNNTQSQRQQRQQQYWDNPASADQRDLGQITVDQIPGHLKALCVSAGLLFGLIGVLFVWIFNMRSPRTVRQDLLKWGIIGFFLGIIVNMIVYSAIGSTSSMGLFDSSLGGSSPTTGGSIF